MKLSNLKPGVQETVFENPGPQWKLGLPGKERSNMAKAKKKNTKKAAVSKGHKNSASVGSSRSGAYKKATGGKKNPKRGGGSKSAFANPFREGKIPGLGVNVSEALGGVGALIVDGITRLVVPNTYVGIALRGVGHAALLWFVVPKSAKAGYGITASALVLQSVGDHAFNLTNAITGQAQRLLPAAPSAPAPAGQGQLYSIPVGVGRYSPRAYTG